MSYSVHLHVELANTGFCKANGKISSCFFAKTLAQISQQVTNVLGNRCACNIHWYVENCF